MFDPNTVGQVATSASGGLPSTGIPYMGVNGTIVVKDSNLSEKWYLNYYLDVGWQALAGFGCQFGIRMLFSGIAISIGNLRTTIPLATR